MNLFFYLINHILLNEFIFLTCKEIVSGTALSTGVENYSKDTQEDLFIWFECTPTRNESTRHFSTIPKNNIYLESSEKAFV